jgi:hypothetical protein
MDGAEVPDLRALLARLEAELGDVNRRATASIADLQRQITDLQRQNTARDTKIAGLQEGLAESQGLGAAYEMLVAIKAMHTIESVYGFVRAGSSSDWQESKPFQQVMRFLVDNNIGLVGDDNTRLDADVKQFAEQTRQLVIKRAKAVHCFSLEEALCRAQVVKDRGLMPALQRISPFAHSVLEAADEIRSQLGPARVVQLAALGLGFL